MTLGFSKYEGLGNDFIVVDAAAWPEASLTPAVARVLCDRHTGIGADGVLWVERLARERVRMVIRNADGTRPEMCGNGVRCVVAWLADRGWLEVGATVIVESDAGPRPATLLDRGARGARVEVDMGSATLLPGRHTIHAEGSLLNVFAVDVGNPHAVLFEPTGEDLALVQAVTALPVFPRGVNVELVGTTPFGFRVRVHERGVGWTRACGTGACAVVAAAVANHRAPQGRPVRVTLDGGDLDVTVEQGGARVMMAGPARGVFEGTVSDRVLAVSED